jgi:hypothetical protein
VPIFCVTTPTKSSGQSMTEPLHGLLAHAAHDPGDDLGLGDRELEALATHHLDEDRHLQLAAAETTNASGGLARLHLRLTFVSSSRSSRSFKLREVTYFPSWPANGEALTLNTMLTVGSSTSTGGSGRGSSGIGHGLADVHLREPGQRHDVAGARLLHLGALQAPRTRTGS